MSDFEFKAYNGGEPFVKPEKPFMLIYKNGEDSLSISWLEREEDLRDLIQELNGLACEIIDAIEIGSYRDIDINETDEI